MTKKDYYEILGITKGAAEEDIKKAYKKASLRVHPDKNRAPKAEEAFKKVSQAFMCLSNSDKRAIYDERGTEEEVRPSYHQNRQQQYYYEEPDLFNMFFGNGHAH